VSNLTGDWITPEQATSPRYWVEHLRETVRFADGVRVLMKEPNCLLLELGPGQTLGGLARQNADPERPRLVISSSRGAQAGEIDVASLLNAAGQLWLAGVELDWQGLHAGERRQRVPLPTYPFERKRYWFDPPDANKVEARPAPPTSIDDGVGGGGNGAGTPAEQPSVAHVAPQGTLHADAGEQPSPSRLTSAQLSLEKANGNGAAATPLDGDLLDPSLDEILAEQLRVMSQQLRLLRGD
ncbi:MAG TPA: hypothetical protein VFX96_01540, partial [Pyrinomonadaceae bacterium]|nr:hypothetical protein [Pyrinomonadaceae bacterium]